ncbi:MAG: tetratricopeptide repeat protein [Bacillota bacterium]
MARNEALRTALLAGDHQEAWGIYQALCEAGQADADTHHMGGRAAVAKGDLYNARRAMDAALTAGASGRTLGQVRLILGEVLRRIGDLSEAAETLERFLAGMWEYPELGPLWQGSGLYNLGLTYRQLGRLDEARAAYIAAAEECRREGLRDLLGWCLRNLAWVLCLQGDTDGAREALGEAEGFCPEEDRWHQVLGWAHVEAVEGWQHSTTAMCKRIIEASSASPDVQAHAYWLLGREALRHGDHRIAMMMAEAALEEAKSFPGDNRARNDAADLWRNAKSQLHEVESGAAGA